MDKTTTITKRERDAALRGLIACRNYPIVYLNMPKSACTTVKNLMHRIDTAEEYPDPLAIHADKEVLLKAINADPKAFQDGLAARKVTFTFVREPFARCYSAFNEKIHYRSKYSFRRIRMFVANRFGAKFNFPEHPNTVERHSQNFAAFLRFANANLKGKTAPFPANPHWMSQAFLLERYRRVTPVDLVGRVEKFELGMRYVLGAAAFDGQIDLSTRYNEGPEAPYKLAEVMTDEVHALLHKLYDADLAEFGYPCPHCHASPTPARSRALTIDAASEQPSVD